MNKNKTFSLVLGGILSAFSLLLMLLVTIVPAANLSLPALAGIVLCPLVIECNYKAAITSYFSVGILSLLFLQHKESAVLYLLLFGHYPILKSVMEQIESKALCYLVKMVSFNLCVFVIYFVFSNVFSVDALLENTSLLAYGSGVILLFANAVFVLYDVAITRLIGFYLANVRPKL